jgi:hypothetical protein
MPDERIRLKGKAQRRNRRYPLGEIPSAVAITIGRQIAHRLAVGQADIMGDDFGGIFAKAVGGTHRHKPLGVADVAWNGCAWSVKTVKDREPFKASRVRLISGRNAPGYSSGISDPYEDVQATGRAVLNIWNARVDEALQEHDDLRVLVMIRNMATLHFVLMEHEATRYIPSEFKWERNKNGNLDGFEAGTRVHRFTWQPHGSQFTVIRMVPKSACYFRFARTPGRIEVDQALGLIGFDDNWIEIIKVPCQDG